ncbi:MAG: CYTH domain-containing protein [bacterium]|nr:CYTH domain-containing protein [bacterium]
MEIEARFINLNREEIEEKLRSLGAQKTQDAFFKEWLFFHKGDPDWDDNHRRIRVRTDGTTTWMTYKANATWEVDSTEEVEFKVSSAEDAIKLLIATGIPLQRHQEKKRITYQVRDIMFDLDFWPKIPMVLEIEAPTKESVQEGARLLDLSWEDAIFVDQKVLHNQYYGIDLNEVKEYRFFS